MKIKGEDENDGAKGNALNCLRQLLKKIMIKRPVLTEKQYSNTQYSKTQIANIGLRRPIGQGHK
jgi:hypothetical protein